ncbi:cytochrome P450 [Streptomonospora alba]|nr:cytochrome P450 [Streptomonospora alba]
MREHAPVLWHDRMGCWVLSRYADCVAVLRDHDTFARDPRRVGEAIPEPSLSVQSLDPPELGPLRRLLMNAVHTCDLNGLAQRTRERSDALLSALATQTTFDVVEDFASPLSLDVICDLLGVDRPERGSFAEASDAIMRSMDAGLLPETAEPGRRARQQLSALVASWFAESDAPGLLAEMRRGAPAAGVPETYVRNTARVLFQGGYSTMVAAIGNVTAQLMQYPGLLEHLSEPETRTTGVDELIRYDGPVQGTSRTATRAVTIGGTRIEAGQTVLVLHAAANHDPDQFPRPDELLLDRSPNPHLGFGWGPHACAGTLPAQIALHAVVEALAARPRLCAAGAFVRRRTATMRGWQHLPAAFIPAACTAPSGRHP